MKEKTFDNHISGGDVIHGGRNFIPNTSLDWLNFAKNHHGKS